MARGPAPKPSHLRQRTNKKSGFAVLRAADPAATVPSLPALEGETQWHALTIAWWWRVWGSPMAGQYLPTGVDGLGRLAMLVDVFYRAPSTHVLAEIRLQESRFGLSPLDRSRLQWEIQRGEEAEQRRQRPEAPPRASGDPRRFLTEVK